jgi:hypothetical protein
LPARDYCDPGASGVQHLSEPPAETGAGSGDNCTPPADVKWRRCSFDESLAVSCHETGLPDLAQALSSLRQRQR